MPLKNYPRLHNRTTKALPGCANWTTPALPGCATGQPALPGYATGLPALPGYATGQLRRYPRLRNGTVPLRNRMALFFFFFFFGTFHGVAQRAARLRTGRFKYCLVYTTGQLKHCPVVQPDNCSVTRLRNRTTPALPGCATGQLQRYPVAQPDNSSATRLRNRTTPALPGYATGQFKYCPVTQPDNQSIARLRYRLCVRGGWTRSCDIRAYAILYGDFCIKSAKMFSC